jgi:hypothetical protein
LHAPTKPNSDSLSRHSKTTGCNIKRILFRYYFYIYQMQIVGDGGEAMAGRQGSGRQAKQKPDEIHCEINAVNLLLFMFNVSANWSHESQIEKLKAKLRQYAIDVSTDASRSFTPVAMPEDMDVNNVVTSQEMYIETSVEDVNRHGAPVRNPHDTQVRLAWSVSAQPARNQPSVAPGLLDVIAQEKRRRALRK